MCITGLVSEDYILNVSIVTLQSENRKAIGLDIWLTRSKMNLLGRNFCVQNRQVFGLYRLDYLYNIIVDYFSLVDFLVINYICNIIIDLFYFSMDGFRVVRIEEVVRNIDILITCTGLYILMGCFNTY